MKKAVYNSGIRIRYFSQDPDPYLVSLTAILNTARTVFTARYVLNYFLSELYSWMYMYTLELYVQLEVSSRKCYLELLQYTTQEPTSTLQGGFHQSFPP